jgi:hypothetical protein
MSKFVELEASAPATLGAVVEAVIRLSTYGEAQILGLVLASRIKEQLPFRQTRHDELPPDTVEEGDLVEASAMPPSCEERGAAIQSSMPTNSIGRSVESATPRVQRSTKNPRRDR